MSKRVRINNNTDQKC